MTLPRLSAITQYQSENMPLHIGVQHLVHGFLEPKD
jgi:hypothetical protein